MNQFDTIRGNRWMFFTCISFFLVNSIIAQSQMNVDSTLTSLQKEVNDSIRYQRFIEAIEPLKTKDPSIGISIIQKFDPQVLSKSYPELYAWYFYHMGELYFNNNQPDSSEIYLELALEKAEDNNNLALMGEAYTKLADMYGYENKWEEFMQSAIEAKKLFEAINDTSGYIKASKQIASTLNQLGRTREAIKIGIDLLPYARTPKNRAIIYNGLAIAYEKEENYDSNYYYNLAYRDEINKTGNLGNITIGNYNLALTETNIGKYKAAEATFDKAIELARDSGVPVLLPYCLISKGGLMTTTGRYREAKRLFDQASQLELNNAQKSLLQQGYYENYKLQGSYEDALTHLELWKGLSDSLNNAEIMNRTNELQIKYESEKKQKEINRLAYEKQLEESKVKSQMYGLIGLGIVLLILSVQLYYIFQQKKKIQDKNRIISKALHEKEILLKEIHHRVKNNLQVISSLLSLQSRSTVDDVAVNALEEGQLRVQSMALIHEHLYKGEKITSVGMQKYLKTMCGQVFSAHQINKDKVTLHMDIDDISLDIGTVVPLGLIFNELITNSCKYAFADGRNGIIKVSLKEKDGFLQVVVSDNGVGKNGPKIISGFGTKLINIFAKKLEAEITENNQNGTTITLNVRNYQRA
jgi:two-component sensor histidine kinase